MDCSAKILLLGKTGVGKSSFINYFLGKDVAKTAAGKPVTTKYFIEYEMDNGRFPIKIYDTKGLEAMNAYNQLDEIIKGVKKRNNSDDIFNWFHTIFYCVSMSNPRFEDFEVNFIRRLQQELTQHIHIILTNCDACNEDKIHQMKEKILNSLKDKRNIKIYEVVSVSMKKRNGKIVSPRGKEVILEQVFDLLLKDVADKVSCMYAKTLRNNLEDIAYKTYKKFDEMIEKTVKFKTLWNMIADGDNAERHLEYYIDNALEQLQEELETTQRYTDQEFNQILQPITQLFNSYRGFVTNSFVDNSKLNFEDMVELSSTNWIKSIDLLNDDFLMKKLLPKLYKIGGCDFDIDEDNIIEVLKAIFHGIGDLFSLKQNLKNLCQDFYNDFIYSIPQEAELQQEAYKRIMNFMIPKLQPGQFNIGFRAFNGIKPYTQPLCTTKPLTSEVQLEPLQTEDVEKILKGLEDLKKRITF